jgi:selenocysteine lyase/cysteine desulfurase
MAGGGDFYAGRALQGMGVDLAKGVLRLSFVHYTDPADMERLMTALDEIL